jgi:hypothetical protein
VPGPNGFSGIGVIEELISSFAVGSIVGTPVALAVNPTNNDLYLATSHGTNSRLYQTNLNAVVPWVDKSVLGIANADWHLLPWGPRLLMVGGTGVRMKSYTPPAATWVDITTNVSPKYIARLGNRVWIANAAWTGPTLGFPSPDPTVVWGSATDDPNTFGTITGNPGLRTTAFFLKDEYGDITGLAATQAYLAIFKATALYITRERSSYDFENECISKQFGTVHPRSAIVDGEDIYLMSNDGPIKIVNGERVERLGSGRVTWTLNWRDSFDGAGEVLAIGTTAPKVYGSQDGVSGVIKWSYAPDITAASGGVPTTSPYIDKAVLYDPASAAFSWVDQETQRLTQAATSASTLSAECSLTTRANFAAGSLNGLYGPISSILTVNAAGAVTFLRGTTDGTVQGLVYDAEPQVVTHWFGASGGGMFRIRAVALPFLNFAQLGTITVKIDGIVDKSTGVVNSFTFTGVDAGGRIDTAMSPDFLVARVVVTIGDYDNSLLTGPNGIRNWTGIELLLDDTVSPGVP